MNILYAISIQKSSKDAKFGMSRTDAQNGVDIIFDNGSVLAA
jgi:hypothetical protein